MKHIQINPALWTYGSVRIDAAQTVAFGEQVDVTDEQWADDLSKRRTRQFATSHRTFFETDEIVVPEVPVMMPVANVPTLPKRDLVAAAGYLGISPAGTKADLAARVAEAAGDAHDLRVG